MRRDEISYEEFQQRLKETMVKHDLNRRELAERMDRPKDTVDNIWKSGRKTFPYADDLYRMSRALGVSMEYLTTGNDDRTRLSDYEMRDVVKELELLKEHSPVQFRNLSEQIHALMLFKMKTAKEDRDESILQAEKETKGGLRRHRNA